MAIRKKAAKKKAAAGRSATLYFRDPKRPGMLWRLVTTQAKPAAGGGLDLTELPPGEKSMWDGEKWIESDLPEHPKHTKNKAGIGV